MSLLNWLRSGVQKLRRSGLGSAPATEAPHQPGPGPHRIAEQTARAIAERAKPGIGNSRGSVDLPPAKRRSPLPSRHVHLGVDFGTCWSKLVLRDYEAATDRCFVIRPGATFDAADNYRIPSSVTVTGGRLYFGWTGMRMAAQPEAYTIRSPKMRAAFPSMAGTDDHPSALSAEDISILVVVYLLQVGFDRAQAYCSALSPSAVPRMSMSMGVPMSVLDEGHLRDQFLTIARVAFDIWKTEGQQPTFAKGIEVDRARSLIASARSRVAERRVTSPREWIRSEAEAGLLWIFRSPLVREGLYGCVDVGAGTTDVSFFRIRTRQESGTWVKDALGFYSARSSPPAMDALGDCLARIDGHGLSATFLRGQENLIIQRHALAKHPIVDSVCRQVYETYRRAWADAFQKEKRESSWHKYGLFVLGGGSKVDPVSDCLRGSVWPGRLAGRSIGDAGFPDDLYDWPERGRLVSFREDATFLLVAYGLSYLGTDVPEVDSPSEMPPLVIPKKPRAPVDQDEYYPK